ncbi:MAG: high frequency lysogenization protein HflD [Thiogranum sp.]
MSHKNDKDRALAFAGILQALQLVQSTAYGKPYDLEAIQTTLTSILLIDTETVEGVYGGVTGVKNGLRLLSTQLMGGKQKPDAELSRYLIVLLHLERKLSKRADLLDKLTEGIERVQKQLEHFDISHTNVLASLADSYAQTISTLQPRIMVKGEPTRLTETGVANQIRALLLAAMRSAVLWRQCGGTRLGLLLKRRKLADTAAELLQTTS